MDFKFPKSDKYLWTEHSKFKMRQYGLSAQRVIRVMRSPERIETGIVKDTIAVMQPASLRKISASRGKPVSNNGKAWTSEIWAMYQMKGKKSKIKSSIIGQNIKYKIISAWRYPGVSPKRDPIPEDILRELEEVQ